MGKTLTATIIMEAASLNYGEGFGNISELKKFNRADGNMYTFASRQALRYDIIRLGNEWFGWNIDAIISKAKGTHQFKDEVTIEDSIEMDLFGYLKTAKSSVKRAAVVRLSHAISLESYNGDMEFLNNMGMAERSDSKDRTPNLASIENHVSLYAYTMTIDLDKIGVDANNEIDLKKEEKFERVQQLLEVIKFLSRNIRGRQENLTPLFLIGGVYGGANPLFQGRVQLTGEKHLNLAPLLEATELTFAGEKIANHTLVGLVSGTFGNEEEIRAGFGEKVYPIEQTFQTMIAQIADHYGVAYDAPTQN